MFKDSKTRTPQQTYCELIQQHQLNQTIQLPKNLSKKYQVYNLIGEGSYGSVYSGIRVLDQFPVAIKIIPNLYRDLLDCKRIYRELILLKQFRHPNIIQLYDYYFIDNDIMVPHLDDKLYLVMEYLPLNLAQYFETNSNQIVTVQEIMLIFHQILKGVNYLELVNIIHRDLRPQNILIGLKNQVKICDFNLARHLYSLPKRKTLHQDYNQASIIMGTIINKQVLQDKTNIIQNRSQQPSLKQNDPLHSLTKQMDTLELNAVVPTAILSKHVQSRFYRAPEIILLQNYNFKSDIWSLGCIFAELLKLTNSSSMKGPIFQGISCYPLSPLKQAVDKEEAEDQDLTFIDIFDHRDQLIQILTICGQQIDPNDPFLERDAWEYLLLNLGCVQHETKLDILYPGVPRQLLDFLYSMLSINDKQRPSSSDLLKNKLMLQYNKTCLNVIQGPINLKIDESSMNLDAIDMKLLFLHEFSEISQQIYRKEILQAYLVLDELLSH